MTLQEMVSWWEHTEHVLSFWSAIITFSLLGLVGLFYLVDYIWFKITGKSWKR